MVTTYEYPVLIAQSDVLSQESSPSTFGDLQTDECFEKAMRQDISSFWSSLTDSDRFEKLSGAECVDKYATDYVTGRKTVVLLASDIPNDQPAVLWSMTANGDTSVGDQNASVGGTRYSWLCGYDDSDMRGSDRRGCTKDGAVQGLETWLVPAKTWFGAVEYTIFADFGTGTLEDFDDYYCQNSARENISLSVDMWRDMTTLQSFLVNPHEAPDLQHFLDNTTNWQNDSWATTVTYETMSKACLAKVGELHPEGCLSEPVDEHCKLLFNVPIWAVVLICNVAKVICMISTAKQKRSDVLFTMGDAVASFLTTPDPTTANRCLMSKTTVRAW